MKFYIDSDLLVVYDDIRRKDNNGRLTSSLSTCTCQLLNTDESTLDASVVAISMAQDGTSNKWTGIVPATHAAFMAKGTSYIIRVIFTDGDTGWKRTEDIQGSASWQE